ncbi:class I SAM-dependent methyltransferase [Siminovitchia acidinfaciens]|uniref:Class I SAM-dependent methyltransferase n=1 Tax=Siminovitchia acidinfaciens TaxID=2321395 RepID=A0A429XUD9_9BACI|nr:class I SAM-dependent methyltransferase [Siminovitchia acidinfaciens]RST71763.1 class I SAM-dependent methyltransferase [Siminovitchia acidinfaciens]
MTEHYYSRKPEVESDPIYWDTKLRSHPFRFKTDRGVFSKQEVDFGSRLLIDSFALPGAPGPLLDLGCGYGPIGLSLAKDFPDRVIHMADINERAVGLAKENAAANQVENVKIYESDAFQSVGEKDFAAILINPPIRAGKQVIFDMFEKACHHLVENGELWIVIQKKQGAPSAKTKLEEVFGEVETVTKKKGYYIIQAKKFASS